jgi:2-methylcitrate dehydratase PrpD
MQTIEVESFIADWIARLSSDELPIEVREAALACIVDCFGVMLAGTKTDIYQRCASLIGASRGECSLVGSLRSTDAPNAAFLNSVAAHALDFDDTSYAGIVHGTAVVLPAVLAACELAHVGGERLLESFICGVETEYVLGMALTDSLYNSGRWCTATLGIIGAAAGAAKALGLSAAETTEALRLAANTSFGLRAAHGTNSKPYICGLSSRLGLEAALAAKAGVAGRKDTFGGLYGFISVFNGDTFNEGELKRLGTRYCLVDPGIAFKLYPLCSAAQAAIESAILLRKEQNLDPNSIVSVQCWSTPLVVSCLTYDCPESPSHAQFSMPFALACALRHGTVSVQHLSEDVIAQLTIDMKKVQMTVDPGLVDEAHRLQYPEASRVEITMKNGSRHVHTVLAAMGMPGRPLTQDMFKKKFFDCASIVIAPVAASALLSRLAHLSEAQSIGAILNSHVSKGGKV